MEKEQKKTDSESKTRLAPMWKVLLHNDDNNSMEHVVRALQETFKFDAMKAVRIMYEAHNSGVALCKVEYLEHAEWHRDALRSFSLGATIEPEND